MKWGNTLNEKPISFSVHIFLQTSPKRRGNYGTAMMQRMESRSPSQKIHQKVISVLGGGDTAQFRHGEVLKGKAYRWKDWGQGGRLDQGHTAETTIWITQTPSSIVKNNKWQSCCWSTRAHVILQANSNWMAGGHCLHPKAALSDPSGKTVLTKLVRSRRQQYSNFDSWLYKVLQLNTLRGFKGKCGRNLKFQHLSL